MYCVYDEKTGMCVMTPARLLCAVKLKMTRGVSRAAGLWSSLPLVCISTPSLFCPYCRRLCRPVLPGHAPPRGQVRARCRVRPPACGMRVPVSPYATARAHCRISTVTALKGNPEPDGRLVRVIASFTSCSDFLLLTTSASCWALTIHTLKSAIMPIHHLSQGTRVDGQRVKPMCAMLCNFTKPTADKPSLLKHSEVSKFARAFCCDCPQPLLLGGVS